MTKAWVVGVKTGSGMAGAIFLSVERYSLDAAGITWFLEPAFNQKEVLDQQEGGIQGIP